MLGHLLFTLPSPEHSPREGRKVGFHPALATEVLAAHTPTQRNAQTAWL